jgi:hypothetical protein
MIFCGLVISLNMPAEQRLEKYNSCEHRIPKLDKYKKN